MRETERQTETKTKTETVSGQFRWRAFHYKLQYVPLNGIVDNAISQINNQFYAVSASLVFMQLVLLIGK